MGELLNRLETDYFERCGDRRLSRDAWTDICGHYPPAIEACLDRPPSLLLAGESGDLGAAILWVVQSALVRPIASESGLSMQEISSASIGSLAHSENPADPMFFKADGGRMILSGQKKYITGGIDSDWIIITALDSMEGGPRAVYIPTDALPAGSLHKIDLGMLRTTSHARLSLKEQHLKEALLLPGDSRTLRRALKRWGIIERTLIMEAYLGLCAYFAKRLSIFDANNRLDEISSSLASSRQKQVEAAMAGKHIDSFAVNFEEILAIATLISDTVKKAEARDAYRQRLDDLGFVRLFLPRPQ